MMPAELQYVVPPVLTAAARLRREDRIHEATALLEAELDQARRARYDRPFRDRVLLGLALADLHVMSGDRDRARRLLADERRYADAILAMIRQVGSPDEVRAASAGCRQLGDRAVQLELLGLPAPEIDVVHWVRGEPTLLAEQHGRVVLLEFWLPSCRSCMAMLPTLTDLHRRFAADGLTVMALTNYELSQGNPESERDRQTDVVRAVVRDLDPAIRVGVALDMRVRDRYGASGLPTYAVIDRGGAVALASSTPDKTRLEQTIVGLLDERDEGVRRA